MPFFNSKVSKVAPAPAEKPTTQRNNFFQDGVASPPPNETFYLCMPGKADFFVDKLLSHLATSINKTRHNIQNNKEGINSLATRINRKRTELLQNFDNLSKQQSLQAQIENLSKQLKDLEMERSASLSNINSDGANYIPADDYFSTPTEAIVAALKKYPKGDLMLIEINAPLELLNYDVLNKNEKGKSNLEVTRPNLLEVIKTIKSIPQSQTAEITKAQKAASAETDSKKFMKKDTEVAELIEAAVDSATEYKKCVLTTNAKGENKRGSQSSPRSSKSFSVMPSIHDEEYFKLIPVNSKLTVAFEEIKHDAKPANEPASVTRKNSR